MTIIEQAAKKMGRSCKTDAAFQVRAIEWLNERLIQVMITNQKGRWGVMLHPLKWRYGKTLNMALAKAVLATRK